MTIPTITASLGAITAVIAEVRACGRNSLVETGGFLLADRAKSVVTCVAIAGDVGILRHKNLFQISERALDCLFTYANEQALWIPVQFHSHLLDARMSLTDEWHGLRVEGFISTIVPCFTKPSPDVSVWGWWQFDSGKWRRTQPVTVIGDDDVDVITFDEDGIHER